MTANTEERSKAFGIAFVCIVHGLVISLASPCENTSQVRPRRLPLSKMASSWLYDGGAVTSHYAVPADLFGPSAWTLKTLCYPASLNVLLTWGIMRKFDINISHRLCPSGKESLLHTSGTPSETTTVLSSGTMSLLANVATLALTHIFAVSSGSILTRAGAL